MDHLTILIYFIVQNKDWKKYKIADWIIVFLAVAFMISIIFRFAMEDMSYIRAIAKTTYPGKRVDYGGDFINKLSGYLASYSAGGSVPQNCHPIIVKQRLFGEPFWLGYLLIPVMYIGFKLKKRI